MAKRRKKPARLQLSKERREELFQQSILYYCHGRKQSDEKGLENAYLLTFRVIYGWDRCTYKTLQSRLKIKVRPTSKYDLFMEYNEPSQFINFLKRFPIYEEYDKEHGRRLRGIATAGSKQSLQKIDSQIIGIPDYDKYIDIGDLPKLEQDELVLYINDEVEKKLWTLWRAEMLRDYEINESADKALVNQVLIERLYQYRLQISMIQSSEHPDQNLDDQMNDSQKRLIQAMEALGVTRKQRLKSGEVGREANLAELSERVERKLQRGVKIEEVELKEETELVEEKKLRGPSNYVADAELAAITLESVVGPEV